ncbi:MAG: SRPBCC family protein [Chryseolinea sp.]
MENTKEREIRTVRMFKAPLELMWEVWTSPDHIANWWGPKAFTSTIHQMDFREGGEWRLTLHGPDGTNYPNRSVFKEIVPFKKIVFEHFNPHFVTTVVFDSIGNETQVDWCMVFDTAELREIVVKAHGAEEGQKQNADRLGEYLLTKLQQSASK